MPKGKIKARYKWTNGAIYCRKTKSGISRWYLDYRDAGGRHEGPRGGGKGRILQGPGG